MSIEAGMYPLRRPDFADLIDGAIGEMSPFEGRFGYYAKDAGPETDILPSGWEGRVVKIQNANTDIKIGYCLEPNDLAASKLAAGRDKDWPFVEAMLRHGIAEGGTLKGRIGLLPVPPDHRERLVRWVGGRGRPGTGPQKLEDTDEAGPAP